MPIRISIDIDGVNYVAKRADDTPDTTPGGLH